MGRFDHKGMDLKTGYFISNESGDILTNVEDSNDLGWTMQPLMEEQHKRAVVYRNPFQIPRRISSQFHDAYLVFKVELPAGQSFASFEDTMAAECVGIFAQFKSELPTMSSQARQTDFHKRPFKKY